MIKGGKGGANTLTGLKFETRVDLRTVFNKLKDYEVKENDLFYKEKLVAKFFKKHGLYAGILEEHNIDWKDLLSKKLLPDETIFVLNSKTLFIIEMKFQNVAGSVDEKLQTCDFKKKQYTKLLKKAGINVEYIYILSDWFKKKEYEDTRKYIKSMGCSYYFKELPLEVLGLPKPD